MNLTGNHTNSLDLLGEFLKATPDFRGKGRMLGHWMKHRDKSACRFRILPGGYKILCDLATPYDCMVWLGQEEQRDLEILRSLIQPGQTFLDCGANIGLWSLVAASVLESQGKVYAFEPNPVTCQRLTHHVQTNNLHHVQVFNSAVGSKEQNLRFECNDQHNISRLISASDQVSINSKLIEVAVVTPCVRVI